MSILRGSIPHPIQSLVYASQPLSPPATQHSLPSGRYSLSDFHRLDRTSLRLAPLLDHFVGTQQDGSRHGQGERPGSIEVEHKIECAGLLHRQVGRFCTIENAPDVASHFAIRVAKARPVAQQTAVNDIFAPRKDRRYPMLGCEQNELSTPAGEERIFGA